MTEFTFSFSLHGLTLGSVEPSLLQIRESYFPDLEWEEVKVGMAAKVRIYNLGFKPYPQGEDFFYDPRREDWHDAGIPLAGFEKAIGRKPKRGEGSWCGSHSLVTGQKE